MTKSLLLNRYILLILMMGSVFCNCRSQNLIQNGSFENYNPPANWNNWSGEFITFSQTPSQRVLLDWDEYNSADYFNSICNGWYNVPHTIFGSSNAKAGRAFIGFTAFNKGGEIKEYIYQQLMSPLQAGKNYCLSFYVSRADRKEYAIKNIGAYFSINMQVPNGSGYINMIPQVENQSGYITDTIGWTKIQGCFIASGGEKYITFGNFNSNSNTDTLFSGTNNPIPNDPKYSYYFLDDIQLWDALTTDIESLDGNKFSVYPNPAAEIINVECKMINDKSDLQIRLSDLIGKEILTIEYKTQLDVSELEKGIYFISILKNGKTVLNQKIVKE